jgi:hypothetical protein
VKSDFKYQANNGPRLRYIFWRTLPFVCLFFSLSKPGYCGCFSDSILKVELTITDTSKEKSSKTTSLSDSSYVAKPKKFNFRKVIEKLPFARYFSKGKKMEKSRIQGPPPLPKPKGYFETTYRYCLNDTLNFGYPWLVQSHLQYSLPTSVPLLLDGVGVFSQNGLEKSRSRISLKFDVRGWKEKKVNESREKLKVGNSKFGDQDLKFSADTLSFRKLEYQNLQHKMKKELDNTTYRSYKEKLEKYDSMSGSGDSLYSSVNNTSIHKLAKDSIDINANDTSEVSKMRKYVEKYEKTSADMERCEGYFHQFNLRKSYDKYGKEGTASAIQTKKGEGKKYAHFLDSLEQFQIGNAVLDFSELSILGLPVNGIAFSQKGKNHLQFGLGRIATPSRFNFQDFRRNKSLALAVKLNRRIYQGFSVNSTIFHGKLGGNEAEALYVNQNRVERFYGICVGSEISLNKELQFVGELGTSISSRSSSGLSDEYGGTTSEGMTGNFSLKSNLGYKLQLNGINAKRGAKFKFSHTYLGNNYSSLGKSVFIRDVRIFEGSISKNFFQRFSNSLTAKYNRSNISETQSSTLKMLIITYAGNLAFKNCSFFTNYIPVFTQVFLPARSGLPGYSVNTSTHTLVGGVNYFFRLRKWHFTIQNANTFSYLRNKVLKETLLSSKIHSFSIISELLPFRLVNTYMHCFQNLQNVDFFSTTVFFIKKNYTFELGNRKQGITVGTKADFFTGRLSYRNRNLTGNICVEQALINSGLNTFGKKYWIVSLGIKILI